MSITGIFSRSFIAAALALLTINGALAQTAPSAESVAMARQIITLKGADTIFNALVPGVIEQAKSMFEQQNPMIGKDLREVATKLRSDLAPKNAELVTEVAKVYAGKFTQQELKDILAFYQSPLGRKMVSEEPKSLDESVQMAQKWSQAVSDEVISKMRAEMKKRGHDI